MKAETQELIKRNLVRMTVEGGNLAETWETLDAKQRRLWITTWRRIEREEAAEQAERDWMNADSDHRPTIW